MRKVDPLKHQAKLQHILEAAVACFAEKGFRGTSTNEICAAAGMSPGNLFHYFPNKQAVIEAIVEEDRREMSERFAQLAEEPDAILAIERLAKDLLKQCADPVYAKIGVEVVAESMRNPEMATLFAASEASIKGDLVTLLRRGIAQGQIDASLDPKIAATWLIALIDGAVSRSVLDRDFKPKAYTPTLMRMIRRFLE
ncbi:TetR/AcrR family transcriptional regulator [Pseudomonas sp. SWRI100]|uniref:TetR/AcrR family transcriptional regulator n=1 Tax=Pseudomonas TaxID=286 RepID=UPI001644A462|nr:MULTISPECIES: TetR/AcrR family transcriptional regulator [Pseudomonas]MBC3494449.1 TetR/AcrR family transcriptional regulator [Pseudomonas sp. SWRI67]MBV4528831.1 TetR/AcrR family transcriptional regulator [Pseudomonas kermanshahensis]